MCKVDLSCIALITELCNGLVTQTTLYMTGYTDMYGNNLVNVGGTGGSFNHW